MQPFWPETWWNERKNFTRPNTGPIININSSGPLIRISINKSTSRQLNAPSTNMPLCPFCQIKLNSSADVRRHQQQVISCFKANQKVFGDALKAKRKKRKHPVENETLAPPGPAEAALEPPGGIDDDITMANPEGGIPMNEMNIDSELEPMEAKTTDVDADAPGVAEKRRHWKESYPGKHRAGATRGYQKTSFERIRDEEVLTGAAVWGPFRDEEEWELAKWLIKNVGHTQAENFLKLPIVSLA